MSFLTEPLPCTAAGKDIHTDFRVWLKFDEALRKKDIIGVLSVYKELPDNIEAALSGAIEFYSGGCVHYGMANKGKGDGGKNTFDFAADSQLIYAAFLGQYGIDLLNAQMHWYVFCALFYGLDDHQKISEIIGYRAMDVNSIADKERRRKYKKLQKAFAIPDNRSEKERDTDNFAALAQGFFQ